MFYQPQQNIRERAARFAGGDQVHIKRWKNPRKLAQRLRETPALDQRLMQGARHLLQPRLLQAFLQDRQPLVEGHSCLKEVGQLFGENEQLAMWNLQLLRGRRGPERTGESRFFWPDRFFV